MYCLGSFLQTLPGRWSFAVGLQVCSSNSLARAIQVIEDSQATGLVPLVLDALQGCSSLDSHVRDALRFRLNIAAGHMADAARDALELARFEQVGSVLTRC
jgi:WD repeat-containing protein 19